ncbi:polymorphic toxin-type HINT domain-containing protein [Tuwongella immobilis]|uniref:polymorphic toxin-type HINT domain-containing protein n=1 Tax=Tuwongella immobilis TaxID=692036 RepID=UPI0013A6FD5C|nr:polymorphic toxin-type HINT domain-containing protein [Tuwongella immobilis]
MCRLLNAGCFAAGTKLWTPDGYRAVETLQPGDLVYSRDEHDPLAPIEARVIEQIFTRYTRVLHLTVAGETIRITGEHPFWSDRSERGLGWAKASELVAGDRLLAASGEWLTIDTMEETADDEVYKCKSVP